MVAKAENRLQRALYQVNQRLSVIIGGGKVEDNNNPIGPAVLGNAFRSAIREFEVNVQVKLIIYKLFDRYVMSGFISNGVLHPHITLATPDKAFGGHLEPGTNVFTFAFVTLGVLKDGADLSHVDDKSYR